MANVIGHLNLDECPDYSLFELAEDDLKSMKAIRIGQIVAEKNKPNPDMALIAQWDADLDSFRKEDGSLKINDRAGNIKIIMKYATEIQAWYSAAKEQVAHVA